jgi:hypothetical protein
MALNWREIVVIPEAEEDLPFPPGRPERQAEGRLVFREEPVGRFSVRWRPGEPGFGARHVLYLGDWSRRGEGGPAVALADYRAGSDHGFYLRDDAKLVLKALAPWRPRFIGRAEAIGKPLGQDLFAMLDAIHVKDDRLSEIRSWPRGDDPAED